MLKSLRDRVAYKVQPVPLVHRVNKDRKAHKDYKAPKDRKAQKAHEE
jgi:hypothetical protein